MAIGGALVLAGVRSVVPPLAAGVAALVLFGATCVRLLTPAVAVAVFGMGLGCAALVTVLGVTSGFEHALTSKLARVNGHVLLTEYGQDFNEYPQVVAQWTADPRVVAASPFAFAMAAVVPVRDEEAAKHEPSRTPAIALVKGLDPALAGGMPGVPEMLRAGDLSALRPGSWDAAPGLALGHRLAARLGVNVGDRVNLVIPAELDGTAASLGRPPRHASFEVLDLVETGVTEFDTSLALCHLSAGQALFFGEARATGMEFWLADPQQADEVAEALMAGLGRDFRATTWREQSEGTVAGLRQIRGAVSLVLMLLEVVAATALVASLLLLVRRKRAEIAALMALGAHGRAVFWIFEAVGLLAGLAGAAIGVGLGLLLSGLVAAYRYPLSGDVYPVDHLPVRLTAGDMLFPGLAALVLCALVSGPVALVAAKQPLLAGLRRT
ncbi:MAG: ABC transporter permease [Myxococcales bacterium]|nr:ABC transporter permease [Myxococcales bacterium]